STHTLHSEIGLLRLLRCLHETLGMSRHQDKQQGLSLLQRPLMRAQHENIFALACTGSDPHRTTTEARFHHRSTLTLCLVAAVVELQGTIDAQLFRRQTE